MPDSSDGTPASSLLGSLASGLRRGLRNAVVYGTGRRGWLRLRLYLLLSCAALLLIWAPVILFLNYSPPSYTSKWTLILPGTGLGASISLESIGQTSTAVSSPYASPSLDPRVNYKAIAESEPVLSAAARSLGLTEQAFGAPRIKLVDQTALMHFSISGSSAEQAHAKAIALNTAFQDELDRLRLDETYRRGDASQLLLQGFQDKLDEIQATMLEFQLQADVVSLEQQQELTITIEQLRKEHALLQAQYEMTSGKLQRLSATLALDPELAASALLLNADPVFRSTLENLAEARATLADYLGKWGPRHPKVKQFQVLVKETEQALLARSRRLLGSRAPASNLPETLLALLLKSNDGSRSALLQELVLEAATSDGIARQVESLGQSLAMLEERLHQNVQTSSTLTDLQRKHQVATAVFTSALAKLDLGKTDPFASYPLVQTLALPSQPAGPDTLKRKLALLGAVVGSLSTLIGLGLAWQRQAFFRKILKNA